MVLDVYLQYVISGTRQNEWSSYIHYLVWSRDSSMYYICFNWKEPVIFMVMGPLTWAAGFSSAVSHVLENPSSFHQLCQLLLQEDQPLAYKFWHSTNTNGLHWGSCKRNHCCCCLVAKLCPTFCAPRTVARQAPPSMGFSRQEHSSGLPFPSPGDLPYSGIEPCLLHRRQILYCWAPGKALDTSMPQSQAHAPRVSELTQQGSQGASAPPLASCTRNSEHQLMYSSLWEPLRDFLFLFFFSKKKMIVSQIGFP